MRVIVALGAFLIVSLQTAPIRVALQGTVIDASTGQPLTGVTVRQLSTARAQALARWIEPSLSVFNSFIPAVVRLQTDVSGQLLDYTISTKEGLENVVVQLASSGMISGRVLESNGSPASKIPVLPVFYDYDFYRWSLIYHTGTTTDAQGRFHIPNLLPRRYWIMVIPRGDIKTSTYRAVLYPGSEDLGRATVIDIKPGSDVRLNDIVLSMRPPRTIRVHVVNPRAQDVKNVEFMFDNTTPVVFDVAGGYATSDGLSLLRDPISKDRLLPGRRLTKRLAASLPGTYRSYVRWQDGSGTTHTPSTRIEFTGQDAVAEVLTRSPEGTLLCDMRLEEPDGTRRVMPNTRIILFGRPNGSISCGPAPYGVAVSSPQQILAAIYDVVSVESDRLDNAEPVPEDLYVSSIRQGNRDVFAEGLQIMKGENTLQLLVRAGAGLVQGKVSNKGGQVVHHAAVVLLPEAKAGRTRPLIAYRQGRTDQNGRFELRGIIPGTYRIYAWANLRPNEFMDSDFISKFENRGRLLQIRERDRASMDLFVLDEQ